MESTAVFWQPIYNVLEDTGLDVLVANAPHIKAVRAAKLMSKTLNGSPTSSVTG